MLGAADPNLHSLKSKHVCLHILKNKTVLFGTRHALETCSMDAASKIMYDGLVNMSNGLLEAEFWHVSHARLGCTVTTIQRM